MSFVNILKKVGTILVGVEHVAAPVAAVVFPQFAGPIGLLDSFVTKIQGTIVTVENNNPLDGQGQVKQDAVINDFNAGLDLFQQTLALRGETLTYDQALLKDFIDNQVAAYNAAAKLKASFKVVPKSA